MAADADVYRAAHLLQALAERLGDLDLDIQLSGGVVLVTGNVTSVEQQEAIRAAVAEVCPECTLRNETRLPQLADPHPAEQIDLAER